MTLKRLHNENWGVETNCSHGVLPVEAAAVFSVLGEARAARIAGIEVSEANRAYLAPGHDSVGSS